MSIGEGILILFLVVMVLCEVEDAVEAYRERTEAMLQIGGIVELKTPSRLVKWMKRIRGLLP